MFVPRIPVGLVIPENWKKWIVDNYGENGLNCGDFKDCVQLSFEDGSSAFFEYAFLAEQDNQIAVFTEHCGYYFFPKDAFEKYVQYTRKGNK